MLENYFYDEAMMNPYNHQAIETLLRHTLPPTPLILFCYDHYPQVYRQFTAQTTHDDRLRQLLEHCAFHDGLGQLLDQLKRRAPEHYTREADYLNQSSMGQVINAKTIQGVIITNYGDSTMNFSNT